MSMKIIKKYLPKHYMIRSAEKIKKIQYIVIHSTNQIYHHWYEAYIDICRLMKQDEKYESMHYLIDTEGNCISLIPEQEVSYSTTNIEENYHIISIACCLGNKEGKFNQITIDSLIQLLIYLKKKYRLQNENIVLHYHLTGTRCPKYYVDNLFAYYDILEKIKEIEKKQ